MCIVRAAPCLLLPSVPQREGQVVPDRAVAGQRALQHLQHQRRRLHEQGGVRLLLEQLDQEGRVARGEQGQGRGEHIYDVIETLSGIPDIRMITDIRKLFSCLFFSVA